jgi:hypothetical protein
LAEAPAFIPDESFDAEVEPQAPVAPHVSPLAPMSEEESATLLASPAEEPERESASTVMFKAADLPWNAKAVSAPVTAPLPPAAPPPPPPPPARVEPVFSPESETVFEPEALDAVDAVEVVEEATVFEEVVEEDLEFETRQPAAVDESESADSGATLMFSGTRTQTAPASPHETSATTASFGVVEETTFSETDFEPEPVTAPEPEPEPEVETVPPASVFAPQPPPRAPEPPRAFTPPPVPPVMRPVQPPPPAAPPPPAPPRFEPARFEPPAPPPPARFETPAPQSFADVAPRAAEREPAPAPVSEAAAVSVPVEMVEKIAQRVVAQISEKAVREIAWEVVPDLAEALIKQEIERLKAELQKI